MFTETVPTCTVAFCSRNDQVTALVDASNLPSATTSMATGHYVLSVVVVTVVVTTSTRKGRGPDEGCSFEISTAVLEDSKVQSIQSY